MTQVEKKRDCSSNSLLCSSIAHFNQNARYKNIPVFCEHLHPQGHWPVTHPPQYQLRVYQGLFNPVEIYPKNQQLHDRLKLQNPAHPPAPCATKSVLPPECQARTTILPVRSLVDVSVAEQTTSRIENQTLLASYSTRSAYPCSPSKPHAWIDDSNGGRGCYGAWYGDCRATAWREW